MEIAVKKDIIREFKLNEDINDEELLQENDLNESMGLDYYDQVQDIRNKMKHKKIVNYQ